MREILFRGKSIDSGEWVYGVPVIAKDNIADKDMTVLVDNPNEIVPREGLPLFEQIDPETVGQYTGLKDGNGTRIFEGDILIYVVDGEYDVNEKYLVVFVDDEAAFKVRFYYIGKFACYDDIAPCEKLEIIGNIHDNPELLEGEDNG